MFVPSIPRKRPASVPRLFREAAGGALHGTLSEGDAVGAFEAALSARLGGHEVAAVSSGRVALLFVLEALGVSPGATLLLSSYNASCVPNILIAAGYKLRFLDIREDTLHIDPAELPDRAGPEIGALILTHIEGSPAPVGDFLPWARRHGVPLVEDAAHALGAALDGAPVGTLGDGAIFSLGRGKMLNTLGGGVAALPPGPAAKLLRARVDALPAPRPGGLAQAVITEGVVELGTHPWLFGAVGLPAMRISRRLGQDPLSALFEDSKEAMREVPRGMLRRLSNLQARFGLEAMAGFDEALRRRQENAAALIEALAGRALVQQSARGAAPAWLELTLQVEDRARFQETMLARRVDTQRTWMDACHALPAFADPQQPPCPVAARVAARAVYLPTYPSLSEGARDHLIEATLGALA